VVALDSVLEPRQGVGPELGEDGTDLVEGLRAQAQYLPPVGVGEGAEHRVRTVPVSLGPGLATGHYVAAAKAS
jgi:hypothetical protein